MKTPQYDDRQNAAFRRLKPAIDKSYPQGWFVAIADDQVIAAAADFQSLEGILRERGIDPRNALVAEAGVDYPDYVTIFV